MARKSKAALSKEAQTQVKKRTDELLDDDELDVDAIDFEDNGLIAKIESTVDQRMAVRRRLENYLEERRLQKEIGDDFDY